MCRKLRKFQFDAREVGILHVMQRCVRRAFLTGYDQVTGIDYSYRKEMIRRRMESLASVYAMDVFTYAIQSNHFHMLIQNRPDVVDCWEDWEVANRWLRIYPGKRIEEDLGVPSVADIETLAQDSKRIAELRIRLSDPSWYMKSLCEPIARRCNREDKCTGHFWEGRFKAQPILDETMLLASSLYLDLNPLRAGAATSLEDSWFTGAHDRLRALQGVTIPSAALDTPVMEQAEVAKLLQSESVANLKKLKAKNKRGTGKRVSCDGWLAPLSFVPEREQAEIHRRPEAPSPLEPPGASGPSAATDAKRKAAAVSSTGLRPSDRGFLHFSVAEYLTLFDWMAQQPGRDGQHVMPAQVRPLLERLKLTPESWRKLMGSYAYCFRRAGVIGTVDSMAREAERRHVAHYHGQGKLKRVMRGEEIARTSESPQRAESPTPPPPDPPPRPS